MGLSRPLYEVRQQVFAATKQLIEECACEDGCPSCVGPAGARKVALALLELVHG
jgi:DEAD/DEAH box helicase domain-containing protein